MMLFQPFSFQNGKTAKNRFFKSAMEEQLGKDNSPTQGLVKLYDVWADGGSGILVTGNVMVTLDGKGSKGDVVLENDQDLEMLKQWATAGSKNDTLMIMQINHAGKQVSKDLNPNPVSASAIPLKMAGMNPPRALEHNEILDLIDKFANTAKLAEQAGFAGVQIHSAHGYLISQFLSPLHNVRTDEWGGSLDNRMQFLLKIYQAIRENVSKDFLVGVKLNSADFQKGGFDENDSIEVVKKLSDLGIDFIEISGGNYESPAMLAPKESTRQREAFFIDYAKKVRAVSQVPLIITGGFRSEQAMNEALDSGDLDFIGIARPLTILPDLPNQIQQGVYQTLEMPLLSLGNAEMDKKYGGIVQMGWYMVQMNLIANGLPPNPTLDPMVVIEQMTKQGQTQSNRVS